jgi:integrase
MGKPLDPSALTHAWARIAKQSNIPGVRLHDLRHFHATLLLQRGTHPKIVQERLGHSSIAITLDTYSHVVPGLQEKAASTFAEAMEEGKNHAASI